MSSDRAPGQAPERVTSASVLVSASAARIFELIADPAQQPRWDGNDNLANAAAGQRIRGAGEVFVMTTRKGNARHNHVVEFEEGRRIAWAPAEAGAPPFGHLWRWELEPIDATHTRVTHTYDWTHLSDPGRFQRAQWTTADRLRASILRLAGLVEDWDERYAEAPRIWSGKPNAALVANLEGMPPGRVLDVGCGEGADAVWLAEQGWQTTALEVSGLALDRARAAAEQAGVSIEWVHAPLVGADLPAGGFDLVCACYLAVRRTPDRDAEYALTRLVAPGGRLLWVHHADLDRHQGAHGHDPQDYVSVDDVRIVLDQAAGSWQIEKQERRERHVHHGAGAQHTLDDVLLARRAEQG